MNLCCECYSVALVICSALLYTMSLISRVHILHLPLKTLKFWQWKFDLLLGSNEEVDQWKNLENAVEQAKKHSLWIFYYKKLNSSKKVLSLKLKLHTNDFIITYISQLFRHSYYFYLIYTCHKIACSWYP